MYGTRLSKGEEEFFLKLCEDLGMTKSEVLRTGLHLLIGVKYGSMAMFKYGETEAVESLRKRRRGG